MLSATFERVRQFEKELSTSTDEKPLELNSDQRAALDTILKSLSSGEHRTMLIRGVTGSGKTEVYMQAVQEVINYGRQAIILVPEISLTPQTKRRFRRRFENVAVLHSHMTDSERHWQWEQIASGKISVVVGARSAIFAPTPNLGMIIIDEEHESSFKQAVAPRYHARQVAIKRASDENIPLILGSATPAIESWYLAKKGDYQLIEMPNRILNRPMPAVVTVDLQEEYQSRRSRGAITRPLRQAMDRALRSGGQVILLLNRRGFATHIQCPACANVVVCPHCEIALTHHRQAEQAICHYCDYRQAVPTECPDCKSGSIRFSGRGTQRLEDEVRAIFPNYRCLRMDTDSMARAGSHQTALDAFRKGEYQILLGTQMIAKGLDIENVTLVGVVNADTALHLPDFRAAERTFQLITQVAGRTGRGEQGGRVIVQTLHPDHEALQAAARHDFVRFAKNEIPIRREHGYPPYEAVARIIVRSEKSELAQATAQQITENIIACAEAENKLAATDSTEPGVLIDDLVVGHSNTGEECSQTESIRVLGPAPAPMAKLRGRYRFHLQVHARDRERMRQAISQATSGLKLPEDVQWVVDIDPVDML